MSTSHKLFELAKNVIPGGVNSPVRACLSVGVDPLFIDSAQGAHLTTVDGEKLLDFVMSWGPMLLGYSHPEVQAAAAAAAAKGSSFGAPCAQEVEMADAVVRTVPSIEMVRMVSSGTEATMSALRLARGYTGRSKVLKFVGNYHGHSDSFLASAGSGLATLSIPGTPGVPEETVAHTLLAPYNDIEAVRDVFAKHGDEIAAVIVEPCAGNMGLVLPAEGFLQGLRDVTTEYGALLIFDEVITGYRASLGGAQGRFGITPDLTTLGKIIGGGYPVGAYGGKREIMERIAPCGDVYQAGTLSGNPVAMAAGLATVQLLEQADYAALEARTAALVQDVKAIFAEKSIPVQVNTVASLFTVFFTEEPVVDFESAQKADGERYASFYRQMRQSGINLAPSGYECSFTSFAHTEADYDAFLSAVRKVQF